MLTEPLQGMFAHSHTMVLDFVRIAPNTPTACNIQLFFEQCQAQGKNPRLPQNRQAFNNTMLEAAGARYLVSQYAEDRSAMLAGTKIAGEGRTFHLGIDVFSRQLEPIYAPSDGAIVEASYEAGFGEYGHYLVFKPDAIPGIWLFFGHLSSNLPVLGHVQAGQQIAQLGDYVGNENGGWSRHLHLQVMRSYQPGSGTPIGYSTTTALAGNTALYPNPMTYFPNWHPAR